MFISQTWKSRFDSAFVLLQLLSDRQMSVLEFSFLSQMEILSQMRIGLGLFQLLLLLGSVFLILLILVQRGKGGGLTGALGGMGGQSAFGAKAGDAFTRVTVITSLVWITLCMVTIALFNKPPPKTVNRTKSPIDIARDMENGVFSDGEQDGAPAAGSSSIGAPDDTPKSPADSGETADDDTAESVGTDDDAAGSTAKSTDQIPDAEDSNNSDTDNSDTDDADTDDSDTDVDEDVADTDSADNEESETTLEE